MKKFLALSTLAAFAVLPLSASAAEGSIYADILSAYVFNGQVGIDEPVFQPGLDVAGPLGFGYSLWANMSLTDADSSWDPNTKGEWNEIDLGLSWTVPYEAPVSLTLGATYFIYPQASSSVDEDGLVSKAPADGSYELYATLSAGDVLLSPTLKVCHDLDNSDDWIAKFSVGHGFELADALSLNLGATVGFAGEYYVESNYGADAGSAFTHVQADASLVYAFSEKFSAGIKGSFSSIIDGDVRDSIEDSDYYPEVDIFFGGVTASYSF